ncbi:hypothetical protein BOTBODRAFT_179961 [Botryobasidium botryosum FD-172 SS1]|uniref:F-box domain-containing protein n=1 Tax=Botryobasidium botryosum (strain FD-172 SS1) TaxID=930990 RepID=A0A067M9T5_BOTB1|nr:hypothetical protein BOTBODRAFT_179961 [Botryobasidium botryosum FD-172 SS1]
MTEGAADAWKRTLQNLLVSLDTFVQGTDVTYDIERQGMRNGRISTPADGVPNHVARGEMYSKISEACADLDSFEGKLELARAKMKNIRNQYHSLVPIHRLPDECLSMIFILGFRGRIRDANFNAVVGPGEVASGPVGAVHDAEDVADVDSDEGGDDEEEEEFEGSDSDEGEDTGAGSKSGEELRNEACDDVASRGAARVKPRPFNLLISQICHRWRKVALNTGQLWTRIDLTEPPPHERMKLWLERSRNYPLDLFFDTQRPAMSGESLAPTLLTALEHLKSSISKSAEPRCINLTINTARSFKNILLVLLELALSHSCIRLQSLVVHDLTHLYHSSHAHQWKSASLSEMLRGVTALHLDAFYFPWDHPAYINLVELTISDLDDVYAPTASQFEAILRGCPLLEYLELENMDMPGIDLHSMPSRIFMRSLHTISALSLGFDLFAFVFDTIRAPRLRRLHLHNPFCADEVEQTRLRTIIMGFLVTAGQSLGYLSISDENAAFRSPLLIALLRKAPRVVSLELCDIWTLRPTLRALTHDGICPELQSLAIIGCEIERGIAILLLSLVTNRRHTYPIQYLAASAKILKKSVLTSLQERVPHLVRR